MLKGRKRKIMLDGGYDVILLDGGYDVIMLDGGFYDEHTKNARKTSNTLYYIPSTFTPLIPLPVSVRGSMINIYDIV